MAHPSKRIDLTGQQFGELYVLGLDHIEMYDSPRTGKPTGRKAFWKCRCSCGKVTVAEASHMKSGLTNSCGHTRGMKLGQTRNGLVSDFPQFNALFNQYRRAAEQRGLAFELTVEQVASLVIRNCHYCGAAPVQMGSQGGLRMIRNGIDRKDNSLGYITENTVSCCSRCNFAKKTMSIDEFLSMCIRVAQHTLSWDTLGVCDYEI
jgi:hypothetical protein